LVKIKKTKNFSETITENFWAVWFLVVITIILVFTAKQDALANFVWQKYRIANLAILLDKNDSDLAMQIGNYYFNGGAYNLDRAKKSYESAFNLKPDIQLAHYQISRIYFLKGDFNSALDEINKELKLRPEIPNSYYVRGLILGYRGNFREAESDFFKFIKLIPSQWAGYNDLAWIQVKLKKFQDAKETILKSFKNIPLEKDRNPWLWTSLGIAYLNLGEYNKAKEAFLSAEEKTNKINADYFWSAYPGNNPKQAENAYSQFKSILNLNLALVYEKLGDFKKSKIKYEEYLKFIPLGPFPSEAEIEERISEMGRRITGTDK